MRAQSLLGVVCCCLVGCEPAAKTNGARRRRGSADTVGTLSLACWLAHHDIYPVALQRHQLLAAFRARRDGVHPSLHGCCLLVPGSLMVAADAETGVPSLPYHEPAIATILVQSSFLLLLNTVNAVLDRLVYCGLLGQVLLGIAWGTPGAKWLSSEAEEVIVQLGYLGLILLVYEGITCP